jgi:hypothetical protein
MHFRAAALLMAGLLTQVVSAAEPKIEITAATYGVLDTGPKTDVKELIVRRIKEGKVRIEVANDLFGDPAPQMGKKLKVEYKLDDVEHSLTISEGDLLLIPEPVLKGPIKIVKAEYGDLETGSVYDVTDDVRARLKNDVMEVEVSNDLFGDPASGVFKQLRVSYTIGDVELVKRAYEGNTMKISLPKPEADAKSETEAKTDAAK